MPANSFESKEAHNNLQNISESDETKLSMWNMTIGNYHKNFIQKCKVSHGLPKTNQNLLEEDKDSRVNEKVKKKHIASKKHIDFGILKLDMQLLFCNQSLKFRKFLFFFLNRN